ncbi:class I SAM-dependent methyltransferase [Paenisporosarcina sp. TG20]|uniref:class I SAM-dependent methyltransferase n=1 Tax=Paenisporosarcina sp. TG20 TaxID=1211706 RepID=UPI0002FE6FA6|nr:class I SAM-dependent methyltransferase [Paenisporosarcina sp. TG20]
MIIDPILPFVKTLLKKTISTGDTVVDATAGNGHDTLFLAQLVGSSGHVYAFDIQKTAVDATLLRLGDLRNHTTVIQTGHESISKFVTKEISVAVFNLGYLPGSDHSIITRPATTIEAIEGSLHLLKVGGLIVLVVYHGHEGGNLERDALLDYVKTLSQSTFQVLKYEFINQKNNPPFVLAIEKIKQNYNDKQNLLHHSFG